MNKFGLATAQLVGDPKDGRIIGVRFSDGPVLPIPEGSDITMRVDSPDWARITLDVLVSSVGVCLSSTSGLLDGDQDAK